MVRTLLLLTLFLTPLLKAQDPAKAVEKAREMEAATLRGDLVALMEFMHPRLRERLEKKLGGSEALLAKVRKQQAERQKSGVKVDAFTVKPATGEMIPVQFARERLLFLPTIKQLSGVDSKGKIRHLEQKGYLIAVSPAGRNEWSFIDGATVSRNDIRSLFPELKKNFKTPPSSIKEIK